MIAESYYWKRDLLKVVARLRRRFTQTRWTRASYSAVEIDVMVGFYAIRKLIEGKKISDEIMSAKSLCAITQPPERRELADITQAGPTVSI